jgi:Phosphotransferase enzyme family
MNDLGDAEAAHHVQQAIVDRVTRDAADWFPGTSADAEVHVRPLSIRRRSQLYAVSLGQPTSAPVIVAKVRTRHSATGGGAGRPRRPTLAAAAVAEEELTSREYDGLRLLQRTFSDGDPRFGAVRPLAYLDAHNTILMEFVSGPTARDLILRSSRLRPARYRPHDVTPGELLPRVGGWLRRLHDGVPAGPYPARQATGRDVVAHFSALEEHLGRRLGRRFADLAGAGSELAADVLPPGALSLSPGHGDFAPRNVLVDHSGRLVVIDPLFRWAVPAVEDLCRFLVGVRLLGLQVHTHGAAFGAITLDRWEQLVISGYYGDRAPDATLRCHQLLILLDKWSAMLEPARRGGWRSGVATASQELATGYVRREALRVLHLARSTDG